MVSEKKIFLRISSCLYSAKSPNSPEPCLWTDQNFANSIWKGSHKEHSCEIISKSDQRFRRRRFFYEFLLHLYKVQEAPIYPSHVYGQIKILRPLFEKGHPRNVPVKLFQIRTSGFRDFLRISSCLYSATSPHSPEPCSWTDQNFANNFWKGPHKEHSCEIISKSDEQFRRRRFFKNFFFMSI